MTKKNPAKNYIEFERFHSNLIVTCNPYKSIKYALGALIYFSIVLFCTICLIHYKEIWNCCNNAILKFIVLFLGGILLFLALNFSYLIFSFIKNALLRNFFLQEQLIISKNKLEYKNNFGKKIDYNLSHIKLIYFNLNKRVEEFTGVPHLIPNYTHVIILKNQNDEIIKKILCSVKVEDISNLFTAITDHLTQIGHFHIGFGINYQDDIKYTLCAGTECKAIKFISAHEYYKLYRHIFSVQQKDFFDTAMERDPGNFRRNLAEATTEQRKK